MKNKMGKNAGIFEGKKWIEIILFLIFAAQFLLLCYFNILEILRRWNIYGKQKY